MGKKGFVVIWLSFKKPETLILLLFVNKKLVGLSTTSIQTEDLCQIGTFANQDITVR